MEDGYCKELICRFEAHSCYDFIKDTSTEPSVDYLGVTDALRVVSILRELWIADVFPPNYERESVMDVLSKIKLFNEEDAFNMFGEEMAVKMHCIRCYKASVAELIRQLVDNVTDVVRGQVCLKCVKAGCELMCCKKEDTT